MVVDVPRPGWGDNLRDAADLALLGIAATIAALPVITLGASVGVASAAVHDLCVEGSLPSWGTTCRRFVRGLLPGIGGGLVALVAVVLISLDLRALAGGAVPGGRPMFVATAVAGGALLGFAGLTLVEVGRRGGRGWIGAARDGFGAGLRRPGAVAAMAGVCALAVALMVLVPLTAPLALGYALFALHVVARRLLAA